MPTIAAQQRGQLYAELMSSNGGCQLPCWWGFELGTVLLTEVRQFYTTLNPYFFEESYDEGRSSLEALFVDPKIEDGTQVRHLFFAQDDIVIEAEIEIVFASNYQIPALLQRLGQPTEVWLWTIPESVQGALPVYFLLYFPENGVLVNHATGGIRVDDVIRVCFDGQGGTIIRLWDPATWDPTGTKGLTERASETSSLTIESHRPIEEVSHWDVAQLYTILTDSTRAECLETPAEQWPGP